MRRLAIFWLVCAAAGFAMAAAIALVFSVAFDHHYAWPRQAPAPVAWLMRTLEPRPHENLDAGL